MAVDAMLTALALIIFVVELQIPNPFPIPGIKLGLSNIISLVAVFELGAFDGFVILVLRILLGSMFAGRVTTLIYSFAGGLLCFLLTVLLKRVLTKDQIWVCSVFGAVAHNIGQVAAAVIITQTPAILSFLPVLAVSGILSGLFTGIIATIVAKRISGLEKRFLG